MSKEERFEYRENKNFFCYIIEDNKSGLIYCGTNYSDMKDMAKLLNRQDQQIAELKAENERLKKYETIYYLNQLQASNEDINKFKQNELNQCINIYDLLKDNTKQVCEKIREKLSLHCDYKDNIGWYMPENKFNLILDQIENDHNEQDKNN